MGNRSWCDFVVWTPHGILIERIKRDEIYAEILLAKLVSFLQGCIAPEIAKFLWVNPYMTHKHLNHNYTVTVVYE